jgi:hypothetical protein
VLTLVLSLGNAPGTSACWLLWLSLLLLVIYDLGCGVFSAVVWREACVDRQNNSKYSTLHGIGRGKQMLLAKLWI